MVKIKYSATERAIVYGSFLVAKDSQVVADLYHDMFGWSLDRRTVERIFEKFEKRIFSKIYLEQGDLAKWTKLKWKCLLRPQEKIIKIFRQQLIEFMRELTKK